MIVPSPTLTSAASVTFCCSRTRGPIMPGVLIVEALAQAGCVLLMDKQIDPEKQIAYFMALDNVKFRRPVVPGDQLRLEVTLLQGKGRTRRLKGEAYVEGQLACEAEMLARVVDR